MRIASEEGLCAHHQGLNARRGKSLLAFVLCVLPVVSFRGCLGVCWFILRLVSPPLPPPPFTPLDSCCRIRHLYEKEETSHLLPVVRGPFGRVRGVVPVVCWGAALPTKACGSLHVLVLVVHVASL